MSEEFNKVSDEVKKIIAYSDDVTLTYCGETSSSGMRAKFILPRNTKTHPFKKFTIREKNKGGQRFIGAFSPIIEPPEDSRTQVVNLNPALTKQINTELILIHWGQTSTAGRVVTFLVMQDESDTHPFEPFETGNGKGKSKGQRFSCALVQMGDDESPIVQSKVLNEEMQRDRDRLETLKEIEIDEKKNKVKIPFDEWLPSRQSGKLCNDSYFKSFLTEEYYSYSEYSTDSADTLRKIFRIASRKELNKEPLIGQWKQLILKYNQWKNKQRSW